MSLIIPANSAAASGGYDVDNSCRFDTASTTHMERSSIDDHTSTKKFTMSFWIKRTTLGTNQVIFGQRGDAENNAIVKFKTNDTLEVADLRADSDALQVVTNRQFTDVSAWYNIVISSDVSPSSPALKIFVNGVQETSFATSNQYSQNEETSFNNSYNMWIGETGHGNSNGDYFSGYLSEFVFIDGYSYNADSFGEFDEDSGIWKPIKVSTLTSGTNVCYMQFEDSSDLGVNSRDDDFTPTNLAAVDQSTDSPTNNFATLNSLNNYWAAVTFSEGNLVYTSNNTGDYYGISPSTIGVSKGKWYFEAKTSTASGQDILGITSRNMTGRTTWLGSRSQEYGYYQDNGEIRSNAGGGGSDTSYGQTYTVNDIIGIYMDLDNNLMYVSDNGSLMNSGAGHTITAAASTDSGFYHFAVGDNSDSTQVWQCNFGGTSGFAISSAVTDDNGFGAFEYSPNITGDSVAKKFYALCSKNLAEFG